MDINIIINGLLLLVTAVTAILALRQYIYQKDSNEQARKVCVYLVALFDTTDNKWDKLMIGNQGSREPTKSMAIGVMIENNSVQPIRDFYLKINEDALKKFTDEGIRISKEIGSRPGRDGLTPIKLLPPGKWLISIDETPDKKTGAIPIVQGMNLFSDLEKFENAGYVPVVRSNEEGIKYYQYIDHMGNLWTFSSDDCKLKKRG